MTVRTWIIVSALLLCAVGAQAATVYIDPTCANNGDGTAGSPCAASGGAVGPKNTWVGLTWTAGNTYAGKGGTSQTLASFQVGGSGTAGNVITQRGITINGTNKSRTDRDYFIVDLPAGARLTARATMDSTADFDVYVYNSVGSLIGASELSTGLTDTVAVTNSSTGTLRRYVEVRFFDGPGTSGSKYQLNLTW